MSTHRFIGGDKVRYGKHYATVVYSYEQYNANKATSVKYVRISFDDTALVPQIMEVPAELLSKVIDWQTGEPVNINKTSCSCDGRNLLWYGCKCGYIQAERQKETK